MTELTASSIEYGIFQETGDQKTEDITVGDVSDALQDPSDETGLTEDTSPVSGLGELKKQFELKDGEFVFVTDSSTKQIDSEEYLS